MWCSRNFSMTDGPITLWTGKLLSSFSRWYYNIQQLMRREETISVLFLIVSGISVSLWCTANVQFAMAECNWKLCYTPPHLQGWGYWDISSAINQGRSLLPSRSDCMDTIISLFPMQYASISAPISDHTQKNELSQVHWIADCNEALRRLRKLLCSSPGLQSPDFTRPLFLEADASEQGVSAVLVRNQN